MKFLKGISILSTLLQLLLQKQVALAGSSSSSPYDLVSPLPLDAELNYEFHGSTVLSRKHIKLTTDTPDKQGMIFSKHPGLLPDNFEFTMDFKLEDGGRTLYGDGLALWFLQETPQPGSMMGMNEYYKGVSIVIDTYRNGKAGRIFPRLVLSQNDGTKKYDKDNDGQANEIDSCGLRGIHNNKRQDFNSIRVSYSKIQRKISVEVDFRHKWETCAIADLDMGPVSIIAASAATGELTESHIIKDLRLVDFGDELPAALRKSKPAAAAKEEMLEKVSGSGTFLGAVWYVLKKLFLIALAVASVAAAFRGWKEYKKYLKRREDIRYKLS